MSRYCPITIGRILQVIERRERPRNVAGIRYYGTGLIFPRQDGLEVTENVREMGFRSRLSKKGELLVAPSPRRGRKPGSTRRRKR